MRRLPYNIAENRKLQPWIFFSTIAGFFILASFAWIFAGETLYNNQKKIDSLKISNQKIIEKIYNWKEKNQKILEQINRQKRQWDSIHLTFNIYIEKKAFSFTEKLDFLETILPNNLQLDKISLNNNESIINFSLFVPNFSELLNLYRRFRFYKHEFLESEKSGIYYVNFQLVFPYDKK